MNIVILESDIKLLAKLERFFRFLNIKAYAVYEKSQLSSIQGISEAILISSSFDKEIFRKVTMGVFFSLEKEKHCVKIALKYSRAILEKSLEFLKVVKMLEVFFLENGFKPLRFSKKTRRSLPHPNIRVSQSKSKMSNLFFTQLPKSLYALFVKLYKTHGGISKKELQKCLYSNEVRSSNLVHVQMHNLRKALQRITNDSFKIIYKDKKYHLITEKFA